MVRTCDAQYSHDSVTYDTIFSSYPFELSDFQKYAIQAIEEGKHILITAHTGSGKTLPAEHAIKKFCGEGKKVIYTSPIKSLSNQKFHEFGQKFPDIDFGILTGDVKFNPEADCLIMTTEILRNTLFQKQMLDTETLRETQLSLHFEMDIQQELACVIFDEIHYINDRDRGKVWEETIMMLPDHVLLVMLSATMDRAIAFAKWIEDIKKREVWWAPTNTRVVPLTHFSYITLRSALNERHSLQNPSLTEHLDKLIQLRHHHGAFQDKRYHALGKILTYFQKNSIYVNPSFVLNNIVKYLHEHNLLPAICFVFSRKKTEIYARKISLSLNDAKTMNIIQKECKQILIGKLPNYKEYIDLPEYTSMVTLLTKGIAVHHSGILPVLREMVEILFAKGYVKLLFATETFAVGVNMPTKTVIFTGLKKYDGRGFRHLLSHEYTQMAGRAGRRGLDTKGYVIHLNNMFETPSLPEYKSILCGKPQRLSSKFALTFNLILRLISTQQHNVSRFVSKSMFQDSINAECLLIEDQIPSLERNIQRKNELLKHCQTPHHILKTYAELTTQSTLYGRKKRKSIAKEKNALVAQHKHLEKEFEKMKEITTLERKLKDVRGELYNTKNYIQKMGETLLCILCDYGFIKETTQLTYSLTEKGEMAANIQEISCLVFGEILHKKLLNELSPREIACVFSCFTNISIPNDKRKQNIDHIKTSLEVNKIIHIITEYYQEIHDIEINNYISSDCEYNVHYELCDLMPAWCDADTPEKCKRVFQEAKRRGISLGEFTKAILKINNIANELEKVCMIQSNIELLDKIKKIPTLTLKSITTNQSLYL